MKPLNPPERILMGPGPSSVSSRVLRALGSPTLGHLDPKYVEIMDQTCVMLRDVFQTQNALTFPVSATGMAGMECIVTNLMEPGDEAIVCVNGVFGTRMVDVMQRAGVTVHAIEVPWGETFPDEMIADAVERFPKSKALAIVHAETSTGAHQPIESVSKIVHEAGMLLVVDAVTSLGGHEVRVDDWQIDAIYSGTQKCLSCPPGLSPVSFSPAAMDAMEKRKTKVQSWYFDVSMLKAYYSGSGKRAYHHTAPVNMIYALYEALAIVLEEGLENRIERHRQVHLRLRAGLETMGISYVPKHSLHTLNCVHIPDGIDDASVRQALLENYSIEIGAGLGPFAGKAWRIGLMGHAATVANVDLLLSALKASL
ncbi:alanine--glyoxylate aminotransferase family protein [Luteolibacter pohnpeiensis]|uniref:Alanine--glyoxylate aminotransferase family protein n=1 Tax=Luteolibacter pohnpeiensis TaxID=454153 RepID=A0A934VPE0_9BACT|nr:alanine--glyoxylate aminotransferase family protein [Luteolibacter pohnpeiensis]MBK1880896.1 alanine--glyoxylate aminotransferase family protein [Luteolibacter pohnpeiensis]